MDRGLRSTEEVRLLTALLCYLIKGLVQRPNDMSSSRDMVRRLQVIVRAEVHGFPSLQSALISDCLTRIDGEPDIGEYRILNYDKRFKPSGARLKSSRAPKAAKPESVGSGRESDDDAAHLSQSAAASPSLTVQDEQWVHSLVNSSLARWLWSEFPNTEKKRPIPVSLLEGPFRFRSWRTLVREDIKYKTSHSTSKFQKAVDTLFPDDWQFKAHDGTKWKGYQASVLDPVIARLDLQPDQNRRRYSEAVRCSIVRHLSFWEYLPIGWNSKVWSYSGKAATPCFGLAANPRIAK